MNIIEKFISIQGEGIRTGRPSLFIRVSGCNLRCVFHNGEGKAMSTCDTSYASFHPEKPNGRSIQNEIFNCFDLLEANPGVNDIVITGGEPLLDQSGLIKLIEGLTAYKDYTITVETNGTITPCDKLLEQVSLWSVSPKLSSSTPTKKDCKKYNLPETCAKIHEDTRINLDALANIVVFGHDVQLKFVYSNEKCVEEILALRDAIQGVADDIIKECQGLVPPVNVNDYIMLMPEGITEKAIISKSDECVQKCISHGWTFSSRMHILIWGNVKEK